MKRRRPHPFVENLVFAAAILLALILAYFAFQGLSRPAPKAAPLPPPEPSVPAPKPLPEIKGSGTTSEPFELPSAGPRRSRLNRKIAVPPPAQK